ncbi:MAG: hypothetical protein IKV76_09690 [Clostridia bacterium]|nr:hypothetical protein [Clostridia bacterium]
MKKRFLYLILPAVTLILEILPFGAVCNFANPDGEPWRETFSYFSLTPFGYANFGPFITAVITCIVFVLLIIYCFTDNVRLAKIVKNILIAGVVTSLMPLLFGISFFSVTGIFISVTLLVQMLLIHFTLKGKCSE